MFSMGHIYKQNQVPKCCCFFATENCGTVMYLVFFKTVQDTRDGTWREGTHGLPNQHQSAPLSNKYNEDDSQHWAPLMVPNGTRADRVIGRFCWLSHYPCRIAVFNPPPPPLSHPLNTQPTHPTPSLASIISITYCPPPHLQAALSFNNTSNRQTIIVNETSTCEGPLGLVHRQSHYIMARRPLGVMPSYINLTA